LKVCATLAISSLPSSAARVDSEPDPQISTPERSSSSRLVSRRVTG
jgi:hypothetical protein